MNAFDLVVVEATPAGVVMAVRAAREGLRVLLATRGRHLGGMLASGLGVWDTLLEGRRAPLYDEVRQAILNHYRKAYGEDSPQYHAALPEPHGHANGRFEPSVAANVIERLVAAETLLTVWRGMAPVAVEKRGSVLLAVSFSDGAAGSLERAASSVFADCTYEGDLAALAGAACRVGREGGEEFGEPHAGRIHLRPSERPPEPKPGALAERRRHWKLRPFSEFQEVVPCPDNGRADGAVQAFNYRTILSCDPANLVPAQKPAGYHREAVRGLEYDSLVQPLPNGKASWNRPQLPGRNIAYIAGDAATRRRIMDEHWEATLGLLYFLQTDPEVPPDVRQTWGKFGLARDEFADNGHRPYEIYVREARRIVGRKILTQHDTLSAGSYERAPIHADSIGVTEWYVDIHACGTGRVADSFADGKMMLYVETVPGQVPYGALVPVGIDNLLVPVCVSASHVAFSALRLEPTWMALGEAAGFAAVQAVRTGRRPAEIDTDTLQRTLADRGVMLTFFNDVEPGIRGGDVADAAAQYFGTKGFFPSYDAGLDCALGADEAAHWDAALNRCHGGALDARALATELAAIPSAGPDLVGMTRRDVLRSWWEKMFVSRARYP